MKIEGVCFIDFGETRHPLPKKTKSVPFQNKQVTSETNFSRNLFLALQHILTFEDIDKYV